MNTTSSHSKTSNQSLELKAETLYERYGKPLEKKHTGQYIAISQDGKMLIDSSISKLMQKALTQLGPGNFIFKIGDRAIGKWL